MGLRERLHGRVSGRTHYRSIRAASSSIVVAEENGKIVGVAQVQVTGSEADLLKLFVDPTMLRNGVGMRLFHWATSEATAMGAHRMVIEADPDAAPFYRRMGAEDCGFAP